jgi:uncharacterized MAPEG superfamily protein
MSPHLPALVTLLTVLLQIVVATNVGRARGKYGVEAPATTGHPDFERAFRIQANTVENTIAFLPSLWLFANYVSSLWAGVFGAVWLVGRTLYMIAYQRDAKARGPGFMISVLAIIALFGGGAFGVLRAMFS